MSKPNIFFRLTKVDVAKRLVEGIATAEVLDKSGEICDYESTKPFYQKWSDEIKKASGGKSLGNLRAMHSNIAAGKIVDLVFDDVKKFITIVAKVVDDAEWNKVVEGVYTGFSQGGEYVKRWKDGEATKYTADPSEVSLVDNPCLGIATFAVVKADGVVEEMKFKEPPPEVEQGWRAKDGSFHHTKAEALSKNAENEAKAEAEAAIFATKKAIEDANAALDKKADEKEDEKEETDEEKAEKAAKEKADAEAKEKEEAEKHCHAAKEKEKEAKKAAVTALVKNETWDAKAALDALIIIEGLIMWEESEDENEAAQIADLKAVVDKLKAFIASEISEVHEKAAKGDLEKNTEIDAKLAKSEALNKSLSGALQDVNALVGTLTKRIETLEKQPAPRKGAVFAVDRSTNDHEPSGGAAEVVNLTKLRLSPEDMRKVRGF